MNKEKKDAIRSLLISIGSIYIIIDRERYPLPENIKNIYKYFYGLSGWCLFVSAFRFIMAFKKNKGEFMKKLDEKGGTILFILTLVLGNDYVFFLSVKMSQAVGIQDPLNALDMLIAYIVIIVTAITTIIWIYKLLKK